MGGWVDGWGELYPVLFGIFGIFYFAKPLTSFTSSLHVINVVLSMLISSRRPTSYCVHLDGLHFHLPTIHRLILGRFNEVN